MKKIAILVSPEIADELKEYGHADFVEELNPYIEKIGEAGVKFGVHEPRVQEESVDSATSYAEKFEKELSKTGKSLGDMNDEEKKAFFGKMDRIHKADDEEMDESDDKNETFSKTAEVMAGGVLKPESTFLDAGSGDGSRRHRGHLGRLSRSSVRAIGDVWHGWNLCRGL